MAGIQYSTVCTDATAQSGVARRRQHRKKPPEVNWFTRLTRARSATTLVRCRGGTDVRSCRTLCLFAAPFDPVQGRVPVLRVGFGALGSNRSDDRAGVYGLGAVSHRMTFPLP